MINEEINDQNTEDDEETNNSIYDEDGNIRIPNSCLDLDMGNDPQAYMRELLRYNQLRLNAHNADRALHIDTPPLTLNLDLACQAKLWAEQMRDTYGFHHRAEFIHELGYLTPAQGENIAFREFSISLGNRGD